ncbi:relaxase domain-containing protein [Escherichia coli]
MVAALYNHNTSHDLNPQLHTHALVFNATFAGEKWRSLPRYAHENGFLPESVCHQDSAGKPVSFCFT